MGSSLTATIATGAMVICALVASIVASSPATDHVVHEERAGLPAEWRRMYKLDGGFVLPVRIGLTQQNLHLAEDFLMEVSDPESPRFGQHWTAKQVAETFAPTAHTVASVKKWLADAGIVPERVSQSQSLNWLTFDATVEETEKLLKAEYHVHEHESGLIHIACDKYSIPASMREHVDFITPTIHFDRRIRGEGGTQNAQKGDRTSVVPKPGADYNDLSTCDTAMTPACLRALYKFPEGESKVEGNSYGIVEYGNFFLQSDLDLFFANYTSIPVGTAPDFASIDGATDYTGNRSFELNGESDLDVQYAMAIVYPQTVTLYQVGDLNESIAGQDSFNTFLDAIDGSYCTFEGGNNETEGDGVYPDPVPRGYKGPLNCGGFAASNVISTSYSYPEIGFDSPFYNQRQCLEYLKLGLQGVTVLYSSGDFGVAGVSPNCLDPDTLLENNGTSGLFNPSFPGTCPYITSVGATQIKLGATVKDPEEACESTIYSGGGFSNFFPLPKYQKKAVRSWFKHHPPPYGADRFNNSQTTRGFPDVSANGAFYQVAVDGEIQATFGTSAASPVFGALITLINEKRSTLGKRPVGFVNPTLYAHPHVLHDIKTGGNRGCGTPGFTAAKGWDPVTGLGTPNYPKLLKLFLSLP